MTACAFNRFDRAVLDKSHAFSMLIPAFFASNMAWTPMPFRQSTLGPRSRQSQQPGLPRQHSACASASDSVPSNRVIGVGSCCLDYLAQVAAWPKPDDKLRTESLETQGGGNCGNALTAAARLGLKPSIVSKIGDDGIGDQIIAELQDDGVHTTHVLRAQNRPSPFTYIIVDRAGGTRTCIHTPSAPLAPEELNPLHSEILADAAVIYFDGRLTEAAVPLARAARKAGIPVLVEAERLRPHLEDLLAEADFVTTSAKFPQAWTGEASMGLALHAMLQRLPLAKWTLTTLGARGSVLLQRCPNEDVIGEVELDDLLADSWEKLSSKTSATSAEPACTCRDGTPIMEGVVVESKGVFRFRNSSTQASSQEAAKRAEVAAAEEAQRNASGESTEGFRMDSAGTASAAVGQHPSEVTARVFVASAAQIPQDKIKDTTGAGDASVGTCLYGICHSLSLAALMKLAGIVSAAKCTGFGARSALPYYKEIRADLLK